MPDKVTFAISETIGLTWWWDAESEKDPARFRRFRTFTNAVGLALQIRGIGYSVGPGNYHAIGPIDDAHQLDDQALLQLLVPAFEEFQEVLHRQNSEESPFLLVGLLLVKALLGHSAAELSSIAQRMIDEELKYAGLASDAFLWGCTPYDQLNPRWKWFVAKVLGASSGDLGNLRKALLGESEEFSRPDKGDGPHCP